MKPTEELPEIELVDQRTNLYELGFEMVWQTEVIAPAYAHKSPAFYIREVISAWREAEMEYWNTLVVETYRLGCEFDDPHDVTKYPLTRSEQFVTPEAAASDCPADCPHHHHH